MDSSEEIFTKILLKLIGSFEEYKDIYVSNLKQII
jgi:hypothetical protein